MQPIGIIRSPYQDVKGMPIQGIFAGDVEGIVELKPQYADGLKDLEEFSHAILIYYFHKSDSEKPVGKPFLENEEHGTSEDHCELEGGVPRSHEQLSVCLE